MARPIAIIPPMEVPVIRSKYSYNGRSTEASSFARKVAGNIPLIPPPSIDKIRFTKLPSVVSLHVVSLAVMHKWLW